MENTTEKDVMMILFEMNNLRIRFTNPYEDDEGNISYEISYDEAEAEAFGYTKEQIVNKINEIVESMEDGEWETEPFGDAVDLLALFDKPQE